MEKEKFMNNITYITMRGMRDSQHDSGEYYGRKK